MDKKKILTALKADLKSAETLRNDLDGKIAKWKDEYDGKPYGNEQKNKSSIVSRDIKKQSEWLHASIIDPFVSTPDIIKASPVTWEDREAARQNELVLNTQFCRQFNRFNFMTKALKVLDREGTVVIKTGWDYEDKEVEVEYPIFMLNQFTGEQTQIDSAVVTETVVTKNQPTAIVCRNEDIYIDPTCMDDMDKCQFVIHRYETDLNALRQDGRYKNLKALAKSTMDSNTDFDPEDETEFKFEDVPRKKLVVHEYWGNYDVNGDGLTEPIVCAWVNDVIIRLESNPFPDEKPPFIVVPFNSVPFQMHGEPNAELISDNQKVKTAFTRGIMDNMAQSNNAQKGIKKGSLDPINRKRYLQGKNFEFNGSPNDFYDGSYNQIPQSVFAMLELQNNEIESITGVKSFNMGISGNSLGGTATGARGALDASGTRKLNIVRNISENMIKPLMRKWMAYNSEFLEEEQVIRITNDDFVEIRRDDLEGRIDIAIQISTAEDNASKAQELAFMLQTNAASMDPEEAKIIRAEIARLQKMPDLAKRIEEFQPQPDPLAVMKTQLEIELLKAQVANEQAKGMENAVDVELKKAKTSVELAKAGATKSKADLDDLTFLERESGRDHMKEIEKKTHDRNTKLLTEKMKPRPVTKNSQR